MTKATRRGRARASIDPSRQAAYDALRLIDSQDAYLNLALPRLLTERGLAARDAAFATELAHGTARLQGSYDAIVDTLAATGATALQPEVRTALRLGCHQLLSMRVPAHAAVGTAVELTRAAVGERPVRLVNAVLRKVAQRTFSQWLDSIAPDATADPTGRLAVRYSHPRWIVEAFADVLDTTPEVEAALLADNIAAAVTLVARPGLTTVQDLVEAGGSPGRWSPYAVTLPGGDPGQVAQVRQGLAGVQDEGSQLAALALSRAAVSGTDVRWLDVCAGPGGKAALLAGLAQERGAIVLASDLQQHRARLVKSSLRAYPGGAVIAADATRPAWRDGGFDRVLADVPCSGLGALRRRPESRWRRTAGDVDDLAGLQRRILDRAVDAARPGGVVAYVTCSPHRQETRDVVDALVAGRDDVAEEDARTLLPQVDDLGDGPHVQLWPHIHGTDAMFVALLRRRG